MSHQEDLGLDELAPALGTPRPLRRLASSPRSRVWLYEFGREPAIVKQITGGTGAAARFGREVTALQLAAHVRPPVVPALLGTVPGTLTIVLEYLPSGPPPPDWPVGYAMALARLHAAAPAHAAVDLPRHTGPRAEDVSAFLVLAGELAAPVPDGAPHELTELCDRLAAPTGRALLHGDPCPGNDIYTPGGVRFVDLEQASLGQGLTELAYLRIGFPTCWCVTDIPASLREQAESGYRQQWRTSTGTEPAGDLADACTGWLIQGDALVERAFRGTADHLATAVREDWGWGTSTARGRLLHRTSVVAALAGEHPRLAATGRLCHAMHKAMRQRWPALEPPPATRAHIS